MEKHRLQLLNQDLPNALVLCCKPLAWLLLVIIWMLSVDLYGWSIGPAVFFGALTAALLPLILLVTYRANAIPVVAFILPPIAIFSGI